jgi:hypothetical protein
LRRRLEDNGNPTAFPDTSIFNESWEKWYWCDRLRQNFNLDESVTKSSNR